MAQRDLLEILKEVRGTGEIGAALTDGIYWDITVHDYNGNAGLYGDIVYMWQNFQIGGGWGTLPTGTVELVNNSNYGIVSDDPNNTAIYENTAPVNGSIYDRYVVTNSSSVTSSISGVSTLYKSGDAVVWVGDKWIRAQAGGSGGGTEIDDNNSSATTTYSSNKINQLLSGSLVYKGLWDASTNTPFISDAAGVNGDFYKVSIAGVQDLGSGPITFQLNDSVIHNGGEFEVLHNANSVVSVNGYIGAVILGSDDIAEGAVNKYFTDARADARVQAAIQDTATTTSNLWSAYKINQQLLGKSPTSHNHAGVYEPSNGNIQAHIADVATNPHAVTKDQVGLDQVDNTSDMDKPVSTATATALASLSGEINDIIEW